MSLDIFSQEESMLLMVDFFTFKCNFTELFRQRTYRRKQDIIMKQIKETLKKLILGIENELMIVQKVSKMQLAENKSDEMFEHFLLNLAPTLSEEFINDLNIYYRSTLINSNHQNKSDLFPSDKRLSIYNVFLQFALANDLFQFSIDNEQIKKIIYMEDALDVYGTDSLDYVYNFYEEAQGCLKKLESKLRMQANLVQGIYRGQILKLKVRNLILCGLFKVVKIAAQSIDQRCENWEAFIKRYLTTVDSFEIYWKTILIRIAVKNNPKIPEVQQICHLINKRFNRGRFVGKKRVLKSEVDKEQKKRNFLKSLRSELTRLIAK